MEREGEGGMSGEEIRVAPHSVVLKLAAKRMEGCALAVRRVAKAETKVYDEHGLYNIANIIDSLAESCRDASSVLRRREEAGGGEVNKK